MNIIQPYKGNLTHFNIKNNKTNQQNSYAGQNKPKTMILVVWISSVVKVRGRVVTGQERRTDGCVPAGDDKEGSGNVGDGLHTTQKYLNATH